MHYELFILFVQCKSQKNIRDLYNTEYTQIEAVIFNIEEKQNTFVYHFKNDSIEGVFAVEKNCKVKSKLWKNVELNKKYKLVLVELLVANTRSDSRTMHINGDFVWDSSMKSIFYWDCKNICGKKIYELNK